MARDFERWILAIVSHDIRSPLNAIDLAARHTLTIAEDPSSVKRDAERVTRGVDRIQHIVSDLLDLSRERHGPGLNVTLASCDLKAICRQVIDEYVPVVNGRDIGLDCTGGRLTTFRVTLPRSGPTTTDRSP